MALIELYYPPSLPSALSISNMSVQLERMKTLAAILLLWLFSEAGCQKCDDTVLKCIKDINGGNYPVSAWTSLSMLWNRHYSIVWYSAGLVQKDNLKCVSTVFGPMGAMDTYYHSCTDKEDISFKTGFSIFDRTFTINDYKGLNLKAYAIYYKKFCLALYACSPQGLTGPHITIYCPTKELDNEKVKAEIEEAKAKLTSCNINDGISLCQEKCS